MENDEEYEHLPREFYYPEERRRNYRKCLFAKENDAI